MKTIVFSLFLICQVCAQQQDAKMIPPWSIGIWEGSFSCQHEDSIFYVRVTIDTTGKHNTIKLVYEDPSYDCRLDSIGKTSFGQSFCRFTILSTNEKSMGIMKHGAFELFKIQAWSDDDLYIQYYSDDYREWVGQLTRRK